MRRKKSSKIEMGKEKNKGKEQEGKNMIKIMEKIQRDVSKEKKGRV